MRVLRSLSALFTPGGLFSTLTHRQRLSVKRSLFTLPKSALGNSSIESLCLTAPFLFLGLDCDNTLTASTPEVCPSVALQARLSQLSQLPAVDIAVVGTRLSAALRSLASVPRGMAIDTRRLSGTPQLVHRNKVVEGSSSRVNRSEVIQRLLAWQNSVVLPIYIGDATTAPEIFRLVNSHGGISIVVADPPQRTMARYYLQNLDEVLRFLTRLLCLRQTVH